VNGDCPRMERRQDLKKKEYSSTKREMAERQVHRKDHPLRYITLVEKRTVLFYRMGGNGGGSLKRKEVLGKLHEGETSTTVEHGDCSSEG